MVETLYQQISASGAVPVQATGVVNFDLTQIDSILLVNNFDTSTQQEASQQPLNGSIELYEVFSPYIVAAVAAGIPFGFCDNRYANGADKFFVEYMNNKISNTSLKLSTYAGWNTNGNTIGTVVSNTNLLTLFKSTVAAQNQGFNALRILEDMWYQADLRQNLVAYVK